MKVFLSWSGPKSKSVAEALRDWLPSVIQEVDPFMSERDIAAGARWLNEINQELEGTNFAIVCVTRENQSAPWLNFEAGAVAKVIETSRVVPLAIDLKMTDVKPPLGHFQGKYISKSGILGILESLDSVAERRVPNLAAACTKWWPDLEPRLRAAAERDEVAPPVRDQRELLEEVLASVRSLGEQSAFLAVAHERMRFADERAAVAAEDAERTRVRAAFAEQTVASAEAELAARRQRDRIIADRVLRDVSKALPEGSRAIVIDDHLDALVEVQSVAELTSDQVEAVTSRAARYAFGVRFKLLPRSD